MAAAFSFTFFVLVDCRDKRDGESGVFSKVRACVILEGKCDTELCRFVLWQYAASWATMLWQRHLQGASAHFLSGKGDALAGCKIHRTQQSELKSKDTIVGINVFKEFVNKHSSCCHQSPSPNICLMHVIYSGYIPPHMSYRLNS